jgi:hypothetical protein
MKKYILIFLVILITLNHAFAYTYWIDYDHSATIQILNETNNKISFNGKGFLQAYTKGPASDNTIFLSSHSSQYIKSNNTPSHHYISVDDTTSWDGSDDSLFVNNTSIPLKLSGKDHWYWQNAHQYIDILSKNGWAVSGLNDGWSCNKDLKLCVKIDGYGVSKPSTRDIKVRIKPMVSITCYFWLADGISMPVVSAGGTRKKVFAYIDSTTPSHNCYYINILEKSSLTFIFQNSSITLDAHIISNNCQLSISKNNPPSFTQTVEFVESNKNPISIGSDPEVYINGFVPLQEAASSPPLSWYGTTGTTYESTLNGIFN